MCPVDEEPIGVLCALPQELGGLAGRIESRRTALGLEISEVDTGGRPVLACVAGVGKVAAARAAAALIGEGALGGLLVVGTCGGLQRRLVPGTLVHCTRAFQADLAVRDDREVPSTPAWREAWRELVGGEEGWFLTADRPVLSLWRRLRLARAFAGPCVADMETAAAAAVAVRAGLPWAALRAVTDGARLFSTRSFPRNFATQAGRAADSVLDLLERLPPVDRTGSPGCPPPSAK